MPPVMISPSEDKNTFSVEMKNYSPHNHTFKPRHDLGCAVEIEHMSDQEHEDYINATPQLCKLTEATTTSDVRNHFKYFLIVLFLHSQRIRPISF